MLRQSKPTLMDNLISLKFSVWWAILGVIAGGWYLRVSFILIWGPFPFSANFNTFIVIVILGIRFFGAIAIDFRLYRNYSF